jgi:flagellar basal-body rod protein FlgB|tara:strand:+ start:662 stop:1060 length:399 start_codon:yes stop_codon:yes gene_type:complete
MKSTLDNYFAVNEMSLQAKNTRLELISENIANVSTPGYKARDLDFTAFMTEAVSNASAVRTTNARHIEIGDGGMNFENAITYHVPASSSLDNNTVEIGVEQAKFGKAAADVQAAMGFMESRISGMRKALRGE